MRIDNETTKLSRQLCGADIRVASAQKELESAKRMQADYKQKLPNAALVKLSAIGLPDTTVQRLSKAGYTRVYEVLTMLGYPPVGMPQGLGKTTVAQLKAAIEKLGE